MMAKTEFLADNAKYLGSAAAALEQVPDAHWGALFEAMDAMGGSDPGIDCEVVITRETLADFDSARQDHWNERGQRTDHTFAGCPAIQFERFQIARGKPRQSVMVVIDMGDLRVALV